jgi:predicted lipid-binding transport protein (Tim44 family)
MRAKNMRWLAALAAVLIIAAPSLADARAGAGTGSGSRGSRTDRAPAPTQTAPSAKPLERTQPDQPQQQQAQKPQPPNQPQAAPRTGSFFSRHPFLSGLMGGVLGAGLFGLLFGGGFGGATGFLGLLLQLALIGGLAYAAVRLFRNWNATRAQPAAYAGRQPAAYAGGMPGRVVDVPSVRSGGPLLVGSSTPLAITGEDYNAFEASLGDIQAAYGRGDLARLRQLATPEMVGFFSEELASNASRGVVNQVEAVRLEQGDLSEAWREGELDYATVAMRFSLLDVTRRVGDGAIVAGSDKVRSQVTEVWTFVRSRGGSWMLSAIQQT